jgi:hypothetical protein
MQVPELTDDAVVELAREGGVAFIPKLSGQRTIALSSLNEAQRQRLVSILEQAFPRSAAGASLFTRQRRPALFPHPDYLDRAKSGALRRYHRAGARAGSARVAGRAVEERRRLRLRLTFGPNKLHAFFRDKAVAVLAEIVHRAAGFNTWSG